MGQGTREGGKGKTEERDAKNAIERTRVHREACIADEAAER